MDRIHLVVSYAINHLIEVILLEDMFWFILARNLLLVIFVKNDLTKETNWLYILKKFTLKLSKLNNLFGIKLCSVYSVSAVIFLSRDKYIVFHLYEFLNDCISSVWIPYWFSIRKSPIFSWIKFQIFIFILVDQIWA